MTSPRSDLLDAVELALPYLATELDAETALARLDIIIDQHVMGLLHKGAPHRDAIAKALAVLVRYLEDVA